MSKYKTGVIFNKVCSDNFPPIIVHDKILCRIKRWRHTFDERATFWMFLFYACFLNCVPRLMISHDPGCHFPSVWPLQSRGNHQLYRFADMATRCWHTRWWQLASLALTRQDGRRTEKRTFIVERKTNTIIKERIPWFSLWWTSHHLLCFSFVHL